MFAEVDNKFPLRRVSVLEQCLPPKRRFAQGQVD